MGTTRLHTPPAPAPAERARSVAARNGIASLVGTGAPVARPLVHRVYADGSAALLLADTEPLLELLREYGGTAAAMLEITDRALVELREPVRAVLWITGWVQLPEPKPGRRLALQIADSNPHPDLLRLGHGATIVRLSPGFAVLADAEGTAALTPVELAAAQPDPFCRHERDWLAHLEDAHPEMFVALSRHLPARLRDRPSIRVRPLAVDRLGLRLRVEADNGDHDVRLAWRAPVSTPDELRAQLALLVS